MKCMDGLQRLSKQELFKFTFTQGHKNARLNQLNESDIVNISLHAGSFLANTAKTKVKNEFSNRNSSSSF